MLFSVLLVLLAYPSTALGQRMNRFTCERKPSHTLAQKLPGDNGFSIKILGNPPVEAYEPGRDYTVVINGSYSNQQFLDFMLVAVRQDATQESETAGHWTHVHNHMTKEDTYCHHVLTSVTFHPSYKKSSATFIWTAPPRGAGCVLFKATVVEHPDIWFSDDGGLTKKFCEKTGKTAIPSTSDGGGKSSGSVCCACKGAKYEVTFVGNWSRDSHPRDFPSKNYESLLHWSDIIGASHGAGYYLWRYDTMATAGVKEVCEYGWPRTLEGEIKQQKVRTVIKANGIWGYPNIYTTTRTAKFSVDDTRPFMSLITMIGPSPDWCVGVDSVNLCMENCSWAERLDLELYPWDAGTDSGMTYLSNNQPTYPREKIHPITNTHPENPASPFYGDKAVKPLATVVIKRIGTRTGSEQDGRCDTKPKAEQDEGDSEDSEPADTDDAQNGKCMVSDWSEFTPCSVTCGIGEKRRSRMFKNPMGSVKVCPDVKLEEVDNCLGLINECGSDGEHVDICVTTPWSSWSPCSVTCDKGEQARTRQFLNPMGELKCSSPLMEKHVCMADILDCAKAVMMVDWPVVCQLPMDKGRCRGQFPRFYYDMSVQKCLPFAYGGCRGNSNRFESIQECERHCAGIQSNASKDTVTSISAVDCVVSEWTPYSSCSVSCGPGIKSRQRSIKVRARGGGAPCPKDLFEVQVCTSTCSPNVSSAPSASDCMITDWTPWTECSASCGEGAQIRERMIKRDAVENGRPCPSELKEMRMCVVANCDSSQDQCMLSDWTNWSDCSETCGPGKTMRQRMVKFGSCSSSVELVEAKSCLITTCPGAGQPVNCQISEWTDWTGCSVPCGLGEQTRFRMVTDPSQDGGTCELVEPKQMQQRVCFPEECAINSEPSIKTKSVDCVVGPWSDWSACNKTCGKGRQTRKRSVLIKSSNGGKECPELKDSQTCQLGKCRPPKKQ